MWEAREWEAVGSFFKYSLSLWIIVATDGHRWRDTIDERVQSNTYQSASPSLSSTLRSSEKEAWTRMLESNLSRINHAET